jgi:hypothetical protein
MDGLGLFGGAMAGAGAGAMGAGTADATGRISAQGFPWAIAIPVILKVIEELTKKSPEEEARDVQRQMANLGFRQPYQSQFPQQLDPAIVQALLTQLKRTSNWGWPAGMGTDTSFIENLLKNIKTPTGSQSYWGR